MQWLCVCVQTPLSQQNNWATHWPYRYTASTHGQRQWNSQTTDSDNSTFLYSHPSVRSSVRACECECVCEWNKSKYKSYSHKIIIVLMMIYRITYASVLVKTGNAMCFAVSLSPAHIYARTQSVSQSNVKPSCSSVCISMDLTNAP